MKFNPYQKFQGFTVPDCIAQSTNLSCAEKLVWSRLAQYAGPDGDCRPSISGIAKQLGLSRSGVLKALDCLEKKRLIKRKKPTKKQSLKHGRRTRYTFYWNSLFDSAHSAPPHSAQSGHKIDIRKEKEPEFFEKAEDEEAPEIPEGMTMEEYLTAHENSLTNEERKENEQYIKDFQKWRKSNQLVQ